MLPRSTVGAGFRWAASARGLYQKLPHFPHDGITIRVLKFAAESGNIIIISYILRENMPIAGMLLSSGMADFRQKM